jgi:hypothetical protein
MDANRRPGTCVKSCVKIVFIRKLEASIRLICAGFKFQIIQ